MVGLGDAACLSEHHSEVYLHRRVVVFSDLGGAGVAVLGGIVVKTCKGVGTFPAQQLTVGSAFQQDSSLACDVAPSARTPCFHHPNHPRDPAMDRIAIFGLPGTGKTTLARELAERFGLPHHELDRVLFTVDGALPRDAFRAETAKLTAADRWVVDGNFSKLRDVTWHRAQVVVWLDYRLPMIVWRVTQRSLRRISGRETGWGHNPTTWRTAFLGQRSVLGNAIRKYRQRAKYERYLSEPEMRHVAVIRLRSSRATHRWCAGLPRSPRHAGT